MMSLFEMYRPRFVTTLAYMLQSTEYLAWPYLRWFWRTQDFRLVIRRRDFVPTRPARALRALMAVGMFVQFSVGVSLLIQWLWQGYDGSWQWGVALLVSYPIVWSHLVTVPLIAGRWLIIEPRQRSMVRSAAKIFAAHAGIRVAVMGSYGKTSMKEILRTVLSEGKRVVATPANRNVAVSHARFAQSLDPDAEIVILEYGEGRPGDIARFAQLTAPTHAVVTGLAPAHLDRYHSLGRVAKDLFSISQFVEAKRLYVNRDGKDIGAYLSKGMAKYGGSGGLGWKVTDVVIEPDASGMSFTISKGRRSISLRTKLVGRHMVGPVAFAAALGLSLGLSEEQVKAGVAKTEPFEHRMQPLHLGGALVIDDTYNGNLEGVRAGTALLAELPAERKWYVTPGLVDQGRDTAKIHHELGELVAAAVPDIVVLMDNSVRQYIEAGLTVGGFQGEVRVEADPLRFYTDLPLFVAAGDVVMMQNDWTDNYQ